jgi:hypothetical protein
MLLRPLVDADREFFPEGMAQVGAVLETTSTAAIVGVYPHEEGARLLEHHDFSEGERAFRSRTHDVDLARLSLLLAETPGAPLRSHEVARTCPGGWLFGGSTTWTPALMKEMSGVADRHRPTLDLALRRLLAAATMRTDPIDAFVDALVVWEALFGTSTEVSFRVTATIAKLLQPGTGEERRKLVKELKGLYGKRSRLVHGGPEPAAAVIEADRDRAIEVAIACFKLLYRDRADLIPISSGERSDKVLLE